MKKRGFQDLKGQMMGNPVKNSNKGQPLIISHFAFWALNVFFGTYEENIMGVFSTCDFARYFYDFCNFEQMLKLEKNDKMSDKTQR